jgi:hypothetical protein
VIRIRCAGLGASLAIAWFALSTCGCDTGSGSLKPGYRERLSWVADVTAPDTVAAGDPFVLQVTTSGMSGCWLKGEDRVSLPDPLEVRVIPFDREYVGSGACTANVPFFYHEITIRASTPGTLVVSIAHRLRSVSGADSTGEIIREVEVR